MAKIEGLVAFSILMENNDGIMGKAPDYIFEHFQFCMDMEDPSQMLDHMNKEKYNKYMKLWFKEQD